jgi:hypothetical protein
LPAFLLMLLIQGFAVYQLLRPVTLRPPKIRLPDEQTEVLEYEINLAPDAPAATNTSAPPEAAQPAIAQQGSTSTASDTPSAQSTSAPPSAVATPVLTLSAMARSMPAPQPILALEATPAPSAPNIVLVPSVDVAAASTTAAPAEEKGAPDGAPAPSNADSTPVRPLAMTPNAAPDRLAAAPISLLPGMQAPIVEPVIAATSAAPAPEPIANTQPDLRVDSAKPEISEITVPQAAADITLPMRAKPDVPKPDLRVEQSRPNAPTPSVPTAARPMMTRADVALNANSTQPTLQVDQAKPSRITPAAPTAQAVRPVLEISRSVSRTPVDGARSQKNSAAPRPSVTIGAPIAANDVQTDASAQSRGSDTADESRGSDTADESRGSDTADESRGSDTADESRGSDTGAGISDATPLGNSNSGLPADPFASGNGAGDRDLAGQGDTSDHRNEFRRYHDPFAEDAPNPLVGLRLREPQLFSDISHFLVKAFGPAALGFAVGASSEIDDFSGPDAGVLIEQWIQQHHSDLQRECRLQQETMDEHVRRLLCGEP